MSKLVDARVMETRMRDLGLNTISQTVSLFKGGTFALAAVLLLDIATQPDGRLLRLILWVASFTLALMSYNAWVNASVIVFRDSVRGIILVIVQMMAELMLFVTLTPRFAEQAWRGWTLVYGVFMILTASGMLFPTINKNVDVTGRVQPMFDGLRASYRGAGRNVFVVGVLALLISAPILVLPKVSPWPDWLSIGFALLATGFSVMGLFAMDRERLAMERMIQNALSKPENVN